MQVSALVQVTTVTGRYRHWLVDNAPTRTLCGKKAVRKGERISVALHSQTPCDQAFLDSLPACETCQRYARSRHLVPEPSAFPSHPKAKPTDDRPVARS